MLIRILQITIILIAIFAINSVLASIKADTYKKEGKESLKKNFSYLAVDKFSKALKLDNSDGETRGYLGIAYTSLAEKTNKGELLKKALYEMKDARKTYEASSINYHLAKTYELSGDIDNAIQEAIESYNQIPLGQTKDKLIALYKIKGDTLLSQNKRDEAIKFYSKFVELKEVNVINEDIIGYELLLDLMPDNFFVHYCLAKLYMEQNLWDKAVIELEYIRKIGISNEDIMGRLMYTYYNLGSKYSNEKKFKEAERYLSYILILDTMNRFGQTFNAIYNLSSIYEQTGDINKAVETLMKLEGIDTQKGQGYYQIGHLFNRKSNLQKAIEYFEKYLPYRHISDINIYSTLGNLYEQTGNIDRAVEILMKLEGFDTQKGQGYYQIGHLFNRKSNPQKAIEYFEKYLPYRHISDINIYSTLGNLYEQTGDINKAVETLMKLEDFDTQKGQGYYQIGQLFNRKSNPQKAIEYFEKYLPYRHISDINIYSILGNLYEQTGDINKAVETLMKLEDFDTQKGQGYYQIGQLFNRKSNPQKAIEYFEKYLPYRHISDINTYSTLGNLYEQAGDIDKAVEIYSKLEGVNYSKGQGHYYNGLLYAKKERWADALKEFEYALKISPKDSKLLVKIGELYEKTGNNIKALEIYKKIIAIDPTKAIEANLSMSRIYEKLGEKEKAISYFNESRNILNKNILKERTSYD